MFSLVHPAKTGQATLCVVQTIPFAKYLKAKSKLGTIPLRQHWGGEEGPGKPRWPLQLVWGLFLGLHGKPPLDDSPQTKIFLITELTRTWIIISLENEVK